MVILGLLGFFVRRDGGDKKNDNWKDWWNKQSDTMKKMYAREYNKTPNQLTDREKQAIHFENRD